MWKLTGTGRSLDQHLKAMCQQVRHATAAAELHIVVNRMIVAAGHRKRGKQRFCHGARGQQETLADDEIIEPALRAHVVAGRIEGGLAASARRLRLTGRQ